jgi:hypothetical protein
VLTRVAGLLAPQPERDMHVVHHRSRSAAPAQGEGDVTSAVRTPIRSPRLARAPSLDQPSFTEITTLSPGIKSAPVVVTTSTLPISRSRTPDPVFERGVPLSRIVTSPPQESSPFNDASPVDVVARRGNERAQAVSRANKLAKMGFAPEVQVLSTSAATLPSHGHGHGHKFGFRSLVQSLKGRS